MCEVFVTSLFVCVCMAFCGFLAWGSFVVWVWVCVYVTSAPCQCIWSAVADFERLTRRHAIKLVSLVQCSVEEASLAVGEVGE